MTRLEHASKAEFPTVLRLCNDTYERLVQPLKEFSPRLVTSGIFTVASEVQPSKAPTPTLFTSGALIVVRLVHDLKAESARLVANGKFIVVKLEQDSKLLVPILKTWEISISDEPPVVT